MNPSNCQMKVVHKSSFTLDKGKEDHLIVGNCNPLHVLYLLYFRRAGTAVVRRARRAVGATWRATVAHSVSTRTGRTTTTCAVRPRPSERSRPPARGTQPPQPWPPPSIRHTPAAVTTPTTAAQAPQQRAVRQVLQRPVARPRGDHRYRQWWWRPLVIHPLRHPRPHSKTLVQFLASRGHLVPVLLRCRRVQHPLRGRMPQNQGQGHLHLQMTRNQRRQLVKKEL